MNGSIKTSESKHPNQNIRKTHQTVYCAKSNYLNWNSIILY